MATSAYDPFAGEELTPLHGEAYPSFAIKSADKNWGLETPNCEWEDRFGDVVGQMTLTALEGPEMRLLYSCGSRTYHDQQLLSLRIARCKLPSGRYEARAFCPACNRVKDRLYFRWQRWACQQCQGLVQRRVLLDPSQQLVVRYHDLVRRVHGPGSETKSALALSYHRSEMHEIRTRFEAAAQPLVLGYPLSHLVTGRWFGNADQTSGPQHVGIPPAYLDEPAPR